MHFDTNINLGQVLTTFSFLFLAIIAWRDLTWRIKNLESWRKEHMIDSDARDELISQQGRILAQVRWQTQKMGGVPSRIEAQYTDKDDDATD